jgi:chromosome segregation ATPase
MDDATRAVFLSWRDEIEVEMATAQANLTAAHTSLQAAQDAVRSESARIGALNATLSRLRPKTDLANALRTRLAKANQPAPTTASRGHAERCQELEFQIADMRVALVQIEIILREPELTTRPLDTKPPVPPLPAFDPIQMPTPMVAA